jgi:APA family basic amino acid/polyamine antiporter
MPRTGAIVALISTFGALNGWILLQGRVPPAAAEDGIFPPQFAKVHGKRRTPVFGLVVSSVLVSGRRRSPRAPTAGRSRR